MAVEVVYRSSRDLERLFMDKAEADRHDKMLELAELLAEVLQKAVPSLTGARWLVVSPFTREHFQQGTETPAGMSKDPSLVVYDNLGGGVGQTIGFSEGREAAQPFDEPTPIDAINAALVDEIFYSPFKK